MCTNYTIMIICFSGNEPRKPIAGKPYMSVIYPALRSPCHVFIIVVGYAGAFNLPTARGHTRAVAGARRPTKYILIIIITVTITITLRIVNIIIIIVSGKSSPGVGPSEIQTRSLISEILQRQIADKVSTRRPRARPYTVLIRVS